MNNILCHTFGGFFIVHPDGGNYQDVTESSFSQPSNKHDIFSGKCLFTRLYCLDKYE